MKLKLSDIERIVKTHLRESKDYNRLKKNAVNEKIVRVDSIRPTPGDKGKYSHKGKVRIVPTDASEIDDPELLDKYLRGDDIGWEQDLDMDYYQGTFRPKFRPDDLPQGYRKGFSKGKQVSDRKMMTDLGKMSKDALEPWESGEAIDKLERTKSKKAVFSEIVDDINSISRELEKESGMEDLKDRLDDALTRLLKLKLHI